MSERILKALMQLFAIIGADEDNENDIKGGEAVIKSMLGKQLSTNLVSQYITHYNDFRTQLFTNKRTGEIRRKRTAVNSVKVLKICSQINQELTHQEKIIVFVKLLEFINSDRGITEQEHEFIVTVADTFNIDKRESDELYKFVIKNQHLDTENLLHIGPKILNGVESKILENAQVEGGIDVLRIESINWYFLKVLKDENLTLNGQHLFPDNIYSLNTGASIRSSKVSPIYYSDVISLYLQDKTETPLSFIADDIVYRFKKGNLGLRNVDINEGSGKLIAIMGGSGSGKSTLLNVLNGNYTPESGSVTINGVDIHKSGDEIEGIIGYVAQDDLLIDELTVYQNLYYNAQLCFDKMPEEEIHDKVEKLLISLGLIQTKDLKVGNPLQKTISGGQRKRLNIALELIREPAVLFVDEPTSGLSSRDSENIMDLLKELTLKGKLIYVVIHQPSSDIYKMFDKLVLLDQGGYPIYYGNPLDSIIYFKEKAKQANVEQSECLSCGNVNPEQIFNIVEGKVVDEYGNLTENRKVTPEEWNEHYKESRKTVVDIPPPEFEVPKSTFSIPNIFKQFQIFFKRDFLSKLTNRQYVIINILEAPALAAILAFFVKYFIVDSQIDKGYIFYESENIPQFLFISVIVALFIGLTVSAEEIIRDKKILAREKFLNLNYGSYIFSKISVMFMISAIQMFLYALVGCWILEIKGMTLAYWAVLFSTSCFANVLGLNVSASFNSAKVIYILIPILIIPQLLFSGIIVSFDKLHPFFSSQKGVPWIGNVMASRWAYEAMAVKQFRDNDYEKEFYEFDRLKKYSNWKKDSWIQELSNHIVFVERYLGTNERQEDVKYSLQVLTNELNKETQFIKSIPFNSLDQLNIASVNSGVLENTKFYLESLTDHYKNIFNKNERAKENKIYELTKTPEGKEAYKQLLNDNKNESLERFVTNRNDIKVIIEHKGELIQKKDLIYTQPFFSGFFEAHFYSPSKKFFGIFLDTFWANIMVIWTMVVFFTITLRIDFFRKLIEGSENLVKGFSKS